MTDNEILIYETNWNAATTLRELVVLNLRLRAVWQLRKWKYTWWWPVTAEKEEKEKNYKNKIVAFTTVFVIYI
jgi:hypothetical protein